jgi:hypothetical protein
MSSRRGTSLADSDTILTIRVAWKVVTPEVCDGILHISASLDVAGAARLMSGRLITQPRRAELQAGTFEMLNRTWCRRCTPPAHRRYSRMAVTKLQLRC